MYRYLTVFWTATGHVLGYVGTYLIVALGDWRRPVVPSIRNETHIAARRQVEAAMSASERAAAAADVERRRTKSRRAPSEPPVCVCVFLPRTRANRNARPISLSLSLSLSTTTGRQSAFVVSF